MRINSKKLTVAVVAGCATAGVISHQRSADASLILTLSEPGYSSVSTTDSVTPGQTTYIGSFGTFTTDISIGFTNLLSASPNIAQLQIQSLDVTNNAPGGTDSLTITLQETSPFTFPGTSTSLVTMSSSLGGTLTPSSVGDHVTFQSYAFPSVGPSVTSGLESYTSPVATAGTASFSVPNGSASFVQTPSYTLENVTNLTIAAGESSNISGTTTIVPAAVPEPASIGLLAGASVLALVRRRRA